MKFVYVCLGGHQWTVEEDCLETATLKCPKCGGYPMASRIELGSEEIHMTFRGSTGEAGETVQVSPKTAKPVTLTIDKDFWEQVVRPVLVELQKKIDSDSSGLVDSISDCLKGSITAYVLGRIIAEYDEKFRLENQERMQAEDQATEKNRRVYYQGILYKVCNILDRNLSGTTVTGSWANPEETVIERLENLASNARSQIDG